MKGIRFVVTEVLKIVGVIAAALLVIPPILYYAAQWFSYWLPKL